MRGDGTSRARGAAPEQGGYKSSHFFRAHARVHASEVVALPGGLANLMHPSGVLKTFTVVVILMPTVQALNHAQSKKFATRSMFDRTLVLVRLPAHKLCLTAPCPDRARQGLCIRSARARAVAGAFA